MKFIIAVGGLIILGAGVFVRNQVAGQRSTEIKIIRPDAVRESNTANSLPPEPNVSVATTIVPQGYVRIVNDSGFDFGNAKNLHAAEYACQQLNVAGGRGFISPADPGVGPDSNLSRTRKVFFQGGSIIAGPLANKVSSALKPGDALKSSGASLVKQIVESWDMQEYGSSQGVRLQTSLPPACKPTDKPPAKFYSGMMLLPRQPRPASNANPIFFSQLDAAESGKSRTGTLADFWGFNLTEITRIYPGDFQYITLSRHYPDPGFVDSGRVGLAKLLADTDDVFVHLRQAWNNRPTRTLSGKNWTAEQNQQFLVQWLEKNVSPPPPPLPVFVHFVDSNWLRQTSHQSEEFPLEAFATKQRMLAWLDTHPPLSASGNNYYELPHVGGQNTFNVEALQRLSARLGQCLSRIDPNFSAKDMPVLLSSVKLPMGATAYIYKQADGAEVKGQLVMRLKGDPRIAAEAPWLVPDAKIEGPTIAYYGRRLVMFQWLMNRSGDWVDKRNITMSGPPPGIFNGWDITAPNYQNACVHDKLSWMPSKEGNDLLAELKLQSFFAGCGDLSGRMPPESFPCVGDTCLITGVSPTSDP